MNQNITGFKNNKKNLHWGLDTMVKKKLSFDKFYILLSKGL